MGHPVVPDCKLVGGGFVWWRGRTERRRHGQVRCWVCSMLC